MQLFGCKEQHLHRQTFFDILMVKNVPATDLVLFSEENAQTASNYMIFKMYCKDYQTVTKKQGVKGFPPFSSPVLLFTL